MRALITKPARAKRSGTATRHRNGAAAIDGSGLQAQLEWIAALPASREAERLLALPEIGMAGRDPMLPALLTLLQWALEEASVADKSWARAMWEELMQLDLRGEPRAAVLALLHRDDPERDVPPELLASSAEEVAAGIVALATAASRRLSRPGGRQSAIARA